MTVKKKNSSRTMSSLNHADVIGAITNGERPAVLVLLHRRYHERFLQRRCTAADDRITKLCDFQH